MIQHPLFSFDFDPRWQILPAANRDNFNFRDDKRDIAIALCACAAALDSETIEPFTASLIAARLRQEDEAAAALGQPTTIYEPIVVPYPWGRAIAYYGHDETGRQFSFSGSVTTQGAINLTLTSDTLSERELLEVMDGINLRLHFDRPALTP